MRILNYLTVLKFVAFMATLIEQVGSNSSSNGESQATNKDRDLTKSLHSCSLIIVSTLDGKLSALDTRQNGALRWTIPAISGPLLSSSLSSLQSGKQVRVIPSLDGGLFQVNGDTIEPIPYTADNLLGSFYKLQDGSMLVGGKEAIACGIEPKTGKVKYVCSAEGCKLTDHDSDEHVQDSDLFVVKRTKQTIRAVDQRTGSERWNFSVGQQDVTFLNSLTSDPNTKCPVEDSEETVEWRLRISIPDGLVAAVKLRTQDMAGIADDIVLWNHKFDSPISAVWMLHGSYLKKVDIFSEDILPGLRESLPDEGIDKPIMYLGSHEGQVYIQHSQHFLNPFLESSMKMQFKDNHNIARRPRAISWKPKLATSASRTPTIVSKEIAIWNPVEYPFDNGYFFFGDVQPVVPPHERRIEKLDKSNETVMKTNKEESQVNQSSLTMEYWKGAIFVVVLLAAITRYIFRFLLPQQKKPELQRLPPPSTTITTSVSEPALQREQSIISNSTSSSSMSNIFVSRYTTDFEHELCLGKGGFGVVFQAKNKVDDCQYAIKRIRLPNCDEAREKVMREVKALAKLEHPFIVRYFNAWFEAPPVGWQEETDELYLFDRTSTELNLNSEVSSHQCNSNGDHNQRSSDLNNHSIVRRRRKKTSSSTKSRHSSSNGSDSKNGRHTTLTADEEDLNVSFDVNHLENEAFLPEADTSGSFGVEFVESSQSGFGVKDIPHENNEDDDDNDSEDDSTHSDSGIIFESPTEGGNQDISSLSSKNSNSSSCKSLSLSFTTSGQSLLSGKHHKCKSTKCTQDTLQAPLYLFIQMQLCQPESLKDWLKINRNHSSCLSVFDQIVNAVEYFHGRGMMHRDLKPSNIFFSLDGSVKVGDFGLVTASVQEPSENPIKDKNGFIDANHTGQVGTQLYMSPEQIKGKAYSHKVDIYSLGLILFELFHTFSTEMERIKVMIDVKRKVIPHEFESRMSLQAELVKWMLSESPKSRPTATEIRTSELYKNIVQDLQHKDHTE